MLDFFEIIRRAMNGPYYPEKDYDLKVVVPKLRQIVKKFDIRFDIHLPCEAIRSDNRRW